MDDSLARLMAAADEYRARKSHRSVPKGRYDSQRRWWPDSSEVRDCCRSISPHPSVKFPLQWFKHCLTISHVAHLYRVDVDNLRRALRGRLDIWSRLRILVDDDL